MTRYRIVLDRMSDWRWPKTGLDFETVDSYLARRETPAHRVPRVINLCRRYRYLSAGYYCSLLAEARNEQPMPTVADIVAISRRNLYAFALPELESVLQKTMRRLPDAPEGDFALHVFFGRPDDIRFKRLARMVFDVFRFPVLRLQVRWRDRWRIEKIGALGVQQVPDAQGAVFVDALRRFANARLAPKAGRPSPLYHLGVLVDPGEALPPSDPEALERLVRAAGQRRMGVEFIGRRDFERIPEFDALFLRETTAIDHHTYQFALKAQQEGIPVIDDPEAILRCTNKVYLNEILATAGLPTPRTIAIDRRSFDGKRLEAVEREIGYPIVLKVPDGSFSRGVVKVENQADFRAGAERLLARSRLILAQAYMFTEFDWRVGVLAGEALYVCRYYMSRNHWQVVKHKDDGSFREGRYDTIRVEDAPRGLVDLAVSAARLIGDGFYGIDLKETEAGFHVIEINDNPSIEYGVEDKMLKGDLYLAIVDEFIRRIDRARRG